jgi:hypothetical protein
MLLGNTNALMSQQDGYALDWHAGQKQFHGERVTEAMCNGISIALRDFS